MSKKSNYMDVKTKTSLLSLVEQRIQSKREHDKKQRIIEPQASSLPIPDLPEGCIFNIIVRLPIESLLASRFVCKSWYGVVNSPDFINAHLQRSDNGLIFLTPVENGSTPPGDNAFSVGSKSARVNCPHLFMGAPRSFRIKFMEIKDGKSTIKDYNTTCMGGIKATCNGLIVLEDRPKGGGLILLNPVTRELKNIPLGTISPVSVESYGFGFCHASRKYKLVHLFVDKLEYVGCEIMDIGSGSWRAVDGPPNGCFHSLRNQNLVAGRSLNGYLLSLDNPIFVMGALHWLPTVDQKEFVVSMPLDDEKFRKTPLPINGRIWIKIFEMGGFLGCVSCGDKSSRIDVWILRSLGVEGWEKQYSMDVDLVGLTMVPLYCGRVNGELLFKGQYGNHNVYAYDRHSRVMRKIEMMKEWGGFGGGCCFPHVNSLVSLGSREREN